MSQLAYEYGSCEPAIDELITRFGDRVSLSDAVRERFGKDESFHPSLPPDAVVTPHSTEEVGEIVAICARHHVPVIPYGTGTALEGHVGALHGGVCINMLEMNQVVEAVSYTHLPLPTICSV